jgi:hypothetical protein
MNLNFNLKSLIGGNGEQRHNNGLRINDQKLYPPDGGPRIPQPLLKTREEIRT